MLRALTGWLTRIVSPNRPAGRTTGRAALALQALEAREVLSAATSPTYLLSSGNLYQVTATSKTLVDKGVHSFAVASTGKLYVLQTNGVLLTSSNGSASQLQQVATAATQFSLATSGSVYLVQNTGALLRSPNGTPGQFTSLEQNVKAVAVDATDKVFALQASGQLLTSSTGLPGSFTLSDRLVSAIKVSTSGSVIVTDWFSQHLTDPGLANLARQEFTTDDALSRGDMLALFAQAETNGTISGAELLSLRAIANNPSLLRMPGYVHDLTYKTVYAVAGDGAYQGHALATLTTGSSAVILEDLVNKWFLGLDHPAAGGSYSTVSGTLFGSSGPQYTDVNQGGLGDCWVLASLAETAARSPSVIKNMFIDNGDGTWSVRFYLNGVGDWVTVDNQLPQGGNLYDSPQNGVLWVALAEKAFAQENACGYLTTSAPGRYAYSALNGGDPSWALSAITGRTAQDNDISDSALAADWKQGGLLVLTTVDRPANHSIVGYHAYAVVNFDAATDTYTLFNPWGINGGYTGGSSPFYPGFVTIKGSQLAANFDGFNND